MINYLTPDTVTDPRPEDPAAREIVRSHLAMRTVVGVLGILLPVFLVAGDILFLEARVSARGSLSAYYHSGMRDVFVGILAVGGMALVSYKLFRTSGENAISIVAGIAAVAVALFPTKRPPGLAIPQTVLQDKLGETFVSTIHYVSAIVFIGSLAFISWFFGKREGARDKSRRTRYSPAFWERFHKSMAGIIVLAIIIIAVTKIFKFWEAHSLLVGEWMAVWAFGASWLAKGLELDVLRRRITANAA